MKISIRAEQHGDYDQILKLTYKAFLTLDFPGRERIDEHYLISLLRNSKSVIRELSFVAELDGKIAGHILYTRSQILHPDGTKTPTITFGPLSVPPEHQKQGIGSALVFHSMNRARELGYKAVVITGVPAYYPKLGFKRGNEYGLMLEDGSSPDALMVYELEPGYLAKGGILDFLSPEFEVCETDHAGFKEFHIPFMKANYSGQLILRPLWEIDIPLMERWLFLPHIAKWYKQPEHWMREIKERRGEFSFLTHLIIEYEGVPIGFCQYYDCYYSQAHEVWNEEWQVAEKEGVTFSIDYLIGEEDYLHKGCGKETIRLLIEKIKVLGAKRIIVDPEEENIDSKRILEANGFKFNSKDYFKELG